MEFKVMTQAEIEEQTMLDAINNPRPDYDPAKPPKHAGMFFRGFNNVFWDGSQFTQKKGYKLLKRKSCKGCPTCDGIDEMMLEEARNWMGDLDKIEDGQIYELILRVSPGSYEYPNDIDVDIEFKKVKE